MAKRRASRTGKDHVTIYDVAEQAGVSVVTVSRVFNDYPHVSGRMKSRVLDAAREIGFSPKLVAKPKRLAVIIGHLDQLRGGGYKANMLMYLAGSAARRGYAVEFIPAENIDLAVQRAVDGVIEFGLTSRELKCLENLPDVPVVLINKQAPAGRKWNSVCSDHVKEAALAAELLLNHGHRKIALVLDEETGWSAEQRRKGFTAALRQKLGPQTRPAVFSVMGTSIPEVVQDMVGREFTGIVNLSDNAGLALLGEFRDGHGLQVPRDLSMVMLENEAVNPYLNPPVSSIEQPLQLLSEAAVTGLIAAMEDGGKHFHHIFPSRLIERDSVRRL